MKYINNIIIVCISIFIMNTCESKDGLSYLPIPSGIVLAREGDVIARFVENNHWQVFLVRKITRIEILTLLSYENSAFLMKQTDLARSAVPSGNGDICYILDEYCIDNFDRIDESIIKMIDDKKIQPSSAGLLRKIDIFQVEEYTLIKGPSTQLIERSQRKP